MANESVTSLIGVGTDLYASTYGGIGVYRTTDLGAHWTPVNNGLADPYVLSLVAVDTLLFAGGGDEIAPTTTGKFWCTSRLTSRPFLPSATMP